jgi:nucleoside-triphosphatase THEP1
MLLEMQGRDASGWRFASYPCIIRVRVPARSPNASGFLSRPGSPFSPGSFGFQMNPRITVLTGDFGAGKTTLCSKIVSLSRQGKVDMAGVFSPPRITNEIKTGIWVQNIRTCERRLLAECAGMSEGTANLRWRFDPANVQWGTEVLHAATPCDLLVIDELGPLELIHAAGWCCAFDILKARRYRKALIVVRPSLISDFRERTDGLPLTIVTITPATRVSARNALMCTLAEAPECSTRI